MAVSFDSTFEKGASSPTSPFSFVSNAGTVTGSVGSNSNRVLIGYVAVHATSGSITNYAMTWDQGGTNQAMTAIGSILTVAGTFNYYIQLFGLIAPVTGAKTIQVSWTGTATDTWLGAVSLFNADQSTGWNNNGTDTGNSTNASSAVTTTNGDMAVVAHLNDNWSNTSIGSGTSDWIDTNFSGNAAMAHSAAAGASTTINWTTTGSAFAWGNVKVNVKQFGTPTVAMEWQQPISQPTSHYRPEIVMSQAVMSAAQPPPYLLTTPTKQLFTLDWMQMTSDIIWMP